MDNKQNKNPINLYDISEIAIFIIIVFLIFIRIFCRDKDYIWIWVVNFIGMMISFINLFINRINSKDAEKEKRIIQSLEGLIFCLLFVAIFFIFVAYFNKIVYSDTFNDVITLLAVLFSIGNKIWNVIFSIIEEYI